MLRRDKWWHREIERIRREHAAERAELVTTICRLAAGRPLPPEPSGPPAESGPRTWTPSPEQDPLP